MHRRAAVAVDLAKIDFADRLAAWAVERQPRVPARDGAADRRREEHLGAAAEPRVPDVHDLAGERDLACARRRLAQLARKTLGSSDLPQFPVADVVAHGRRGCRRVGRPTSR